MKNLLGEAMKLNLALLEIERASIGEIDGRGFIIAAPYPRQFKALRQLGFQPKIGLFGLPASSFTFARAGVSMSLDQAPEAVLQGARQIIYEPYGRDDIEGELYDPARSRVRIASVEEILGLLIGWACVEKVKGSLDNERILDSFFLERPIMCLNPCLDTGRYSAGYHKNIAGLVVTYPEKWILVQECEPLSSYSIVPINGSRLFAASRLFYNPIYSLAAF